MFRSCKYFIWKQTLENIIWKEASKQPTFEILTNRLLKLLGIIFEKL